MNTVRQLAPFFIPAHYNLALDISRRTERRFGGEVRIVGTLAEPSNTIALHAKDLTIVRVTVDNTPATVQAGDDDELIIMADAPLTAGNHTLHIAFSGTITDAMSGLYPGYYKKDGQDKELLGTQLESHSARELFPCIDEPAAKATFDITLTTETGITVVGNMPIAEQTTRSDVLVTRFEQTPKMSTYLVAFVAGELDFIETTTKGGVIVRAYTTTNVEHARFGLELAAKLLDFMNDFFAEPFPLPKCDLVCVPDFSALAMENWGLIIMRESALLVDDAHSSASNKQLIAEVISHELAHQWFGNLVTMRWWDDLWLNESFAKWMEHYGVDYIFPEWRSWESFKGGEQNVAFSRDSLANVQAVRQPVNHPDELHSLFDPAIVYAKGSALILMLQAFVGDEAFKTGLRTYMQRHKYGNATSDDLWSALEETSGKSVKEFMTPWLAQPGHPVVMVEDNSPKVILNQKRFSANPSAEPADSLWPIPLLSSQLAEASFAARTITTTSAHSPLHINGGGGGFYHTRYPASTLTTYAKRIQSGELSTLDCQSLLIDALHLCRGGYYSATDLLHLIDACRNQSSYAVWQAVGAGIESLKLLINEDPIIAPLMRSYIIDLAYTQYQRLGWEARPDEPHFDTLMRPLILGLMLYGEHPEATAVACKLFDTAKRPSDLPGQLRSVIIGAAVRTRGSRLFAPLFTWYESASGEERLQIASGIAAARDPQVAELASALFSTKKIKSQDLRSWYAPMMYSHYLRPTIWHWVTTHWDWISAQYKDEHEYSDFPRYTAAGMTTTEELAQYRNFFDAKQNETALARLIAQGIDDISIRVAWRARDMAAITAFLRNR